MRAAGRRRPSFSLRGHNDALAAGVDRAHSLEDRLVEEIVPILETAADVAARNFERLALDHASLTSSLRQSFPLTAAVDVQSTSTMVALYPTPEQAAELADDDGYPAESLHVTLVYLGETDGPLTAVSEALQAVAASHGPLEGTIGGYGQFETPGGPVGILLPDVPGLIELRVAITEALVAHGIDYARSHGYTAHMTVDDSPEPGELEEMLPRSGTEVSFGSIWVVRGDVERLELPLSGARPVTAAGIARSLAWQADHPGEHLPPPPHIAELIAAGPALPGFCLAQELRGKTDPVRIEAVKNAMTPALEKAGLSFDPVNPFAEKALARSASQIVGISQTTQLDVMKVVRRAYDEGLTIPQTSKAIQTAIRGSSGWRARMIARTELAQAAQGGSLAATRIVQASLDEAAGAGEPVTLYKQWMTAPGAPHPRHEDYDGLDGQTRQLDEPFDVGGEALMYPGDPDGVPEETINCRCTLVYTEDASELSAAAGPLLAELELRAVSRIPRRTEIAVELRALAAELAAAAGPATWTSPAPDEILQVHCESPGASEMLRLIPGAGDTISVGPAPFVPEPIRERIQTMALDSWPPARGAEADKIFGAARDTVELYSRDGVWEPSRRAIHDDVIAAHFRGKVPAAAETKTAYFTAGGGASGKSAASFGDVTLKELDARKDVIFVDPDRIKIMLPEYKTLVDAGDPFAASGVHEESSALAKTIVQEGIDRGFSVVLDSTGSGSTFVSKVEAMKAAGYETKVTMFSIPTNEAIARSVARGDRGGRYVAIEPLKIAHRGASANLDLWKDLPAVNEWRVYDNTAGTPELVAEKVGGKTTILDPGRWASILAKGHE